MYEDYHLATREVAVCSVRWSTHGFSLYLRCGRRPSIKQRASGYSVLGRRQSALYAGARMGVPPESPARCRGGLRRNPCVTAALPRRTAGLCTARRRPHCRAGGRTMDIGRAGGRGDGGGGCVACCPTAPFHLLLPGGSLDRRRRDAAVTHASTGDGRLAQPVVTMQGWVFSQPRTYK
jgi:hypothetical protein